MAQTKAQLIDGKSATIEFSGGSSSAPAITFTGDTNTGIYSPGADQVAISTGGSGRLFVDASGNVGINTASTIAPGGFGYAREFALTGATSGDSSAAINIRGSRTVSGGFGDINFWHQSTSNRAYIQARRGSSDSAIDLDFITSGGAGMRITSAGLVGIGVSAPINTLHVAGTGSTQAAFERTGSNGVFIGLKDGSGNLTYLGNTNGVFSVQTPGSSYSDKLVVTSAGLVGIGTSSPSSLLHVSGGRTYLGSSDGYELAFTRTGNYFFWYNDGGNTIGKLSLTTTAGAGGGEIITFTQDTKRVGIGVTSPGSTLDVNGPITLRSSGTVRGYIGDVDGVSNIQLRSETQTIFKIVNDEAARIDASRRLLVGTSTGYSGASVQIASPNSSDPVLWMHITDAPSSAGDVLGKINFGGDTSAKVAASIEAAVDAGWGTGDNPGRLVFSVTADGASSPTERMRIAATGVIYGFLTGNSGNYFATSVAAGTTGTVLRVAHSATSNANDGTISFQVFSNGNVQNTNNSYGAISDIKLKENIVDANSQWDDLKALQVRKYNFKEGQTHAQIGLIAQEVELVSPGLVSESPDRDAEGNDLGTTTKSVNYSVLYMKAVKALQEAMERIEQLEASNADLLSRVTALETA